MANGPVGSATAPQSGSSPNRDDAGEDGFTIVLSAIQMAAILENETVAEGGTLANRVVGGLRLLGCAIEGAAAGALLLAPEPTLLTKLGGTALGAFAADQCVTGGRQILTGRDARSLTDRAAGRLAQSLGASPSTARNVGMAVEIIVPLGPALLAGAVRAGAVRAGRLSLLAHEGRSGLRVGGHTIREHVGLTEHQLRQRLAATASRRNPPAQISTYKTLEVAEQTISRALRHHATEIRAWSRTPGPGKPLVLRFDARTEVGFGVVRESGKRVSLTSIRVVLRRETYNGMPYYILTSFPI